GMEAFESGHVTPVEPPSQRGEPVVRFHGVEGSRVRSDREIQAVKSVEYVVLRQRFACHYRLTQPVGHLAELVRLRIAGKHANRFAPLEARIAAGGIGSHGLRSPRTA